jgi:hypothetical protein
MGALSVSCHRRKSPSFESLHLQETIITAMGITAQISLTQSDCTLNSTYGPSRCDHSPIDSPLFFGYNASISASHKLPCDLK